MNVMKKAHQIAREILSSTPTMQHSLKYKYALAQGLREAHKEYKAMNEVQRMRQVTIEQFEEKISVLTGYIENNTFGTKWMVVCQGMPINFDAPRNVLASVGKATKWNSRQFAEVNADKVTNGNGVKGEAVKVVDFCHSEISELQRLIKAIKEA